MIGQDWIDKISCVLDDDEPSVIGTGKQTRVLNFPILVIGDVHWKQKESYKSSLVKFFKYLIDITESKETTLIFTGDFFDSSSVHAEDVIDIAISFLLKFKDVHIISGNHELNKIKGNILKPLNRFPTIHTYLEKREVIINDIKFLFLPFLSSLYDMKEQYENLEWNGDYCIAHLAYPGTNFGHIDEINLEKINAIKLYGHIHEPNTINETNIIIGVPQITRIGEEFSKRIIGINKNKNYISIDIPEFLSVERIEFGEKPKFENNIIIVNNAPSIKAIRDKYKNYYIEENHCSILRTENQIDINTQKELLNTNLLDNFRNFNSLKNLSKEVFDCCSQYIIANEKGE